MRYGSHCRWASKFLTDAYLLHTSLVESLHLIARAIEASLRSRCRCCAISIQIYPERSFQVHRADKSRLLVKTRLFILQMEWPFFSPNTESVSQKQRSVSCLKRIKSMLYIPLRQSFGRICSCTRTHTHGMAIRYTYSERARAGTESGILMASRLRLRVLFCKHTFLVGGWSILCANRKQKGEKRNAWQRNFTPPLAFQLQAASEQERMYYLQTTAILQFSFRSLCTLIYVCAGRLP